MDLSTVRSDRAIFAQRNNMAEESKPALGSGTIWGGLLALVPFLSQVYETVVQSGVVLSPKAASIVAAVGGALAILRRVYNRDTKPIKGLIIQK